MKIEYVKYNSYRRDQFALKTTIGIKNADRIVMKEPVSPQAQGFLHTISENGRLLQNIYQSIKICPFRMSGNSLEFSYIKGISFQDRLLDIIEKRDKKAFIGSILKYQEILQDDNRLQTQKITSLSAQFNEIFGTFSLQNHKFEAINVSNIDLSFENLIFLHDHWIMLDYEWVFSFPIPIKYILYRNIGTFYAKFYHKITKGAFISYEEILKIFSITAEEKAVFEKMEENFQKYVHKDSNTIYQKYIKKVQSLETICNLAKQLESGYDFARLYWMDSSGEYSEECTSSIIFENEFSFSAYRGARTIKLPCNSSCLGGSSFRLDVSSQPCAFLINKISLLDENEVELVPVKVQRTNCSLVFQNYLIFLHDDTQIICKTPSLAKEDQQKVFQIVVQMQFEDIYDLLRQYQCNCLQENERKEQEKQNLERQLSLKQQENQDLKQQLSSWQEENQDLKQQLSSWQEKNQDLIQQLSFRQEENHLLQENCQSLRLGLDEKQQELSRIYESRSWGIISKLYCLFNKKI